MTAAAAKPASLTVTGCAKGSVRAVIGGHVACLHTGVRCRKRYAPQYRKHRFTCVNGRLRKIVKKRPPVGPVYPEVPSPPRGPDVTTLQLPPAAALPSGAVTLPLPAGKWLPDVANLATTSDSISVSSGLLRVDPATNAIAAPLTQAESEDIAAGEGSIWASDYDAGSVRRFDAGSGKLLATIPLPGSAGRAAAAAGLVDANGAIWVAEHHGGTVDRIDPATNKLVARVTAARPGASGPLAVAAGLGSVWVDVPNENAVFRIDPQANKIQAIIVFPASMSPCGGIAVGASAVWVTSCLDDTKIGRIDPGTNTVASVLDVGGRVIGVAAEGDTVWFAAGGDPGAATSAPADLLQLRADDTVARRYALPSGFISGGAAVAFGSIWISDFAQPQLIRVPDPG